MTAYVAPQGSVRSISLFSGAFSGACSVHLKCIFVDLLHSLDIRIPFYMLVILSCSLFYSIKTICFFLIIMYISLLRSCSLVLSILTLVLFFIIKLFLLISTTWFSCFNNSLSSSRCSLSSCCKTITNQISIYSKKIS